MSGRVSRDVRSAADLRVMGADAASEPHGATQAASCEGGAGDGTTAALEQIAGLCAELGRAFSALAIEQKRLATSRERAVMRSSPSENAGAPAMPKPRTLLSAKAVADLIGCDPRTIRRWRAEEKLPPAFEVGGIVRWHPEDIERWRRERTGGLP